MVFTPTKTSDGVVLRIYAQGEIPVSSVTGYLNALEHSYNSSYVFDKLAEVAEQRGRSIRPTIMDSSLLWNAWLNATPENIAALVPRADKLQLKGVMLRSPGFWDVLGALNPLNFILEYLKLSHEQSKDREYRNQEEARKLSLENEILRTDMIERKMNLLRQAGKTDYELQILAEQLLINPVQQLGEFQIRGEIGSAEMVSLEESSSSSRSLSSSPRRVRVPSTAPLDTPYPDTPAPWFGVPENIEAESGELIRFDPDAEVDPSDLPKLKKRLTADLIFANYYIETFLAGTAEAIENDDLRNLLLKKPILTTIIENLSEIPVEEKYKPQVRVYKKMMDKKIEELQNQNPFRVE